MLLLNFSHPLSPSQLAQAEALTGQAFDQVIHLPVQFDAAQPFAPQLDALVASIPLTPAQWQSEPVVLILPALNFIAAMLLAHLHGRMGYFPTILRLRPAPNATPPVFEVAELINLQQLRDAARTRR